MSPASVDEAMALLERLGAGPWLIRHHELVVEAGRGLIAGLEPRWIEGIDGSRVLIGCALHDVGKVIHPEEQSGPGGAHEAAGERLLSAHGVDPEIARCCVTHAAWTPACAAEDLLIALADTLWKGARRPALEDAVVDRVATLAGVSRWTVDPDLAITFEAVATGADDRLERSRVPRGSD